MKSTVVLVVLAAVVQACSANTGTITGALQPGTIESIVRILEDNILYGSDHDAKAFDDSVHTKLELLIRDALLLLRDATTKPLPDLGLPVLDPLDYTGDASFEIDNDLASLKVTLLKAVSEGISKFQVDRLDLFLFSRSVVLDLVLPEFNLGLLTDIPEGSWVTPLKVHLDDRLNVTFSSANIKVGLRAKLAVKNLKLSVSSINLNVDLGDWKLAILCERVGLCTRNPGIYDLLSAVARDLVPRLLTDWLPVAEKYITKLLDEKLQALQ